MRKFSKKSFRPAFCRSTGRLVLCRYLIAFVLLPAPVFSAKAQRGREAIRLNQTGFYPEGAKIAVVTGKAGGVFYVVSPDLQDTVYSGQLTSGRSHVADFSSLREPGEFVLCVPGCGRSYVFEIGQNVHEKIADAALRGFYYQRASLELLAEYAGKWARPAGHPDTAVVIHASAAGGQRPEGTSVSSPGGWYDAGDYNKYVVNSGITMATLLSLYEDFPEYFRERDLHIPESSNELPDFLDETLWNLRWMLSMQDPYDGGVYHKLTAADFEGMIMPPAARSVRYLVQKSTAASLDFAAVMAQAARVYKSFDEELPGLADSCLSAAVSAWEWAVENPRKIYDQEKMNLEFDPDVNTGAYGDVNVSDEFTWAAAELYISTREERYCKAVELIPGGRLENRLLLPSWSQVRLLGGYSLLRHENKLSPALQKKVEFLKRQLTDLADSWITQASAWPYETVMGHSPEDFVWGSNAVAANQGILLIQAYRISSNKDYLRYALANLDYLLGRNATGYSFLTGYGDKTPMHPHHRISMADGVQEPVPGLLAGGPNPGMQDGCYYSSAVPCEAYTDHACSYASNEIAINWNAPFVYLVSALEILQDEF